MRQGMIITVLLTCIGMYLLYPKQEPMDLYHQGAVDIHSFTVEVSGEVWFPGEYIFYESITLGKVVEFCGGFTDLASTENLNLSMTISKDRKIEIPKLLEKAELPIQKVNINHASFSELLKVPHMTESRAAQLIIYRETHGHFTDLEDLIFVKYIGVVTLEKIKPYLSI